MSGFEFEFFFYRDERGENESADTMVETKKKDLEGGYETEYEEDMQSGK